MSSRIDRICSDLFRAGTITFNEWAVISQGVMDWAGGSIIAATGEAQFGLLNDDLVCGEDFCEDPDAAPPTPEPPQPHAWVNNGICCRRHAALVDRMGTMIVCPECGDKRCNKAENCRLDCANIQQELPFRTAAEVVHAHRVLSERALKWCLDYGATKQSTMSGNGFVLTAHGMDCEHNLEVPEEYVTIFESLWDQNYVGETCVK